MRVTTLTAAVIAASAACVVAVSVPALAVGRLAATGERVRSKPVGLTFTVQP